MVDGGHDNPFSLLLEFESTDIKEEIEADVPAAAAVMALKIDCANSPLPRSNAAAMMKRQSASVNDPPGKPSANISTASTASEAAADFRKRAGGMDELSPAETLGSSPAEASCVAADAVGSGVVSAAASLVLERGATKA